MVRHHNGFGRAAKPVVAGGIVMGTGYGGVTVTRARWAALVGPPLHPTSSAVIARFTRAIRYAAAAMLTRAAAAYWIPAVAGTMAVLAAFSRTLRTRERTMGYRHDLSTSSFRGARSSGLAARSAPELCGMSPSFERRAQGRPDAGWHPRPPCEQECTGQEPQVQPERPGLPCAMAYDLYALSSVHRAFWPPSSTRCIGTSANLIPASGYQDHATSPSVPAALVSCSRPVHRIPPQRP